jgi:hypothetical protein
MTKSIAGFEGMYAISENDVITNLKFNRVLKINYSTTYPSINLCKNNVKCLRLIHRLVAEAFIPNPDNKPHVNHKNGNKRDFSISNLEWTTVSENCLHAYRTGLATVSDKCKQSVSERHSGSNHYNSKKVYHLITNEVYDTIREAAKANNIPVQTLHRHLHRDDNKTELRFINN